MRGMVSDIQRFSTGDGPGIRTTVFVKGCPLRCAWCHNPETLSAVPQMLYFGASCTNCGVCARVCPRGAHSFAEGRHLFDRGRCDVCGKCVFTCGSKAMRVYGREYTAEELANTVTADADYFALSGGGVTLSGGEPLAQGEFCAKALRLLKEREIHTLVDTSGHVPRSAFEAVASYTDLFYFDLKCADTASYARYTGGDLDLIVDNLGWLVRSGAAVEIRIPVIPGVNDSPEQTAGLAGIIRHTGVGKVWLLPYHRLGSGKYTAMGAECMFETEGKPDLAAAAELFLRHGVNVCIET